MFVGLRLLSKIQKQSTLKVFKIYNSKPSKIIQGLPAYQIFQYFLISFFSYLFVFLNMHFLTEKLKIKCTVAFFFTYLIVYVFDYTSSLKIIFKKDHSLKRMWAYLCYIFFFFICGNILFYISEGLKISDSLRAIGAILILFPFRFLTQKYFVFRS